MRKYIDKYFIKDSIIYKQISVNSLINTIKKGYYIPDVRNEESHNWFEFNDINVEDLIPSENIFEKSYFLLYIKI